MGSAEEKEFLTKMEALCEQCRQEFEALTKVRGGNSDNLARKIAAILHQAAATEQQLRITYQIPAERFKTFSTEFERLQQKLKKIYPALHQTAAANSELVNQDKNLTRVLKENELFVYVHLFNLKGFEFASWDQLLSSAALAEHCVTRPIYEKLEIIEELLRTEPQPERHAYLKVIINQNDILSRDELKDRRGHTLIRLKDRALSLENIVCFCHKNQTYRLITQQGKFLKLLKI